MTQVDEKMYHQNAKKKDYCLFLPLYLCRAAQLEITKLMSRQVSRGSAVDYQADEQAGVARLSWRLSIR